MAFSLIQASLVRSRLALPDDEEVNAHIEAAMAASIPAIRTLLQTQFETGKAEDVFFIDPKFSCPVDGHFILKLSNGFVKESSVLYSKESSFKSVQTTAPALEPELVRAEKGLVLVPLELRGLFVRVAYDYGFDVDDDIPDWLQEVAFSYTVKMLAVQQIGDDKPELTKVFKFINDHGATILNSHLRSCSDAVLPMNQ